MDKLNQTTSLLKSHIQASQRISTPLKEEQTLLVQASQQTSTKQSVLNAFKSHFLLSSTELLSLTSSSAIESTFFDSLERCKQIHKDSQILLSGNHDQRLGLQVLDTTSRQLDAAFQKLYRWTTKELSLIDFENTQLSANIRKGIKGLAERPVLFKTCLDEFGRGREKTLNEGFYNSLTGNVSQRGNKNEKAIELNAHEPIRYIGDMFAWVHSAAVGEKEALQNLFISDAGEIRRNIRAALESEPWLKNVEENNKEGEEFDGRKALVELVDNNLAGVLQQLKSRVEQTIKSHDDAVLAYQIGNLVGFYSSIFAGLLGDVSNACQVMFTIKVTAMEEFEAITRHHVSLLQSQTTDTSTLTAPDFLLDALNILQRLIKSYDSSFSNHASIEEKNKGFHHVLSSAFDPYLDACNNIAENKNMIDKHVFIINCLVTCRDTLKGPSYTSVRIEQIDQNIDHQHVHLVHQVYDWILTESNLQELLIQLEGYDRDLTIPEMEELRQISLLQHDTLADLAQQLDSFLPSSMEDARQLVSSLEDHGLARHICQRAADNFIQSYNHVERVLINLDEETMKSDSNHDDNHDDHDVILLRDIFPRTTEDIRVLLA